MTVVTHAPNAFEQAMLELLNRVRMDPDGEYDRLISGGEGVQSNIENALNYFGVDLTLLETQLAGQTAVQPLAWNDALATAADGHTALLIANESQSHQEPGEADLGDRILAAGYDYQRVKENVFSYTDDPLYGHAGFYIDWGYDSADVVNGEVIAGFRTTGDGVQDPPGHRLAILDSYITEAGIAAQEYTGANTDFGPWVVTQNFGLRGDYVAQLLGVVIEDADGDAFYDMGEGLGDVSVLALGASGITQTATWDAGGYQMELAEGSYTLVLRGGGLGTSVAVKSVTMGAENTKVDLLASEAVAGTAQLSGTTAGELLAGADGMDQLLSGKGGSDTLLAGNGDDVLLGDTLDALLEAGVSGQVYRLYQATLDRAPDGGGHQSWMAQIVAGITTLEQAAGGFVASAEFQATYGSLTNSEFVELLYQNVLGRAADATGLANWTGQLTGGSSRASVVVGFSESAEFQSTTAADAQAYASAHSAAHWTDDVYRLYQATLDRAPDAGGLASWVASLGSGTAYLTVVTGFVASAEFQATYGALTDAEFVEQLYQNVLGRAADATGLSNWTGQLTGGTSREEVVRGFAQSAEFVTGTEDALTAYMRGLETDDTLYGGAGENRLYGGALADQFVFEAVSGAGYTVAGLEAWDTLAFSGFGYGSEAAALAQFSQSGSDLVLSDQGVTITLEDVLLADLETAQIVLV